MKWPVIIASVSSMFAVMINSSNGIVRILNTMGREGLLPRIARVHRPQAPHAVARDLRHRRVRRRHRARRRRAQRRPRQSRGRLNVYGYLGFLLTLGILPVYVLTNLAAARYFARPGAST